MFYIATYSRTQNFLLFGSCSDYLVNLKDVCLLQYLQLYQYVLADLETFELAGQSNQYSKKATGRIMDESWFNARHGQETFLFYKSMLIHSWAHPTSCAIGKGILLLGVKCLGCEADLSPPSNAELNGWSHTSTPPYAFIPKAAYF